MTWLVARRNSKLPPISSNSVCIPDKPLPIRCDSCVSCDSLPALASARRLRTRLRSIFSVACRALASVCSARRRISEATTAKPRPASPARAASTAALSARMLTCWAMRLMSSSTSSVALVAACSADSASALPLCRCCATARVSANKVLSIWLASALLRRISSTEPCNVRSSLAARLLTSSMPTPTQSTPRAAAPSRCSITRKARRNETSIASCSAEPCAFASVAAEGLAAVRPRSLWNRASLLIALPSSAWQSGRRRPTGRTHARRHRQRRCR